MKKSKLIWLSVSSNLLFLASVFLFIYYIKTTDAFILLGFFVVSIISIILLIKLKKHIPKNKSLFNKYKK